MNITHRSAVDDLHDGISTTYCGLKISLFDDLTCNDPTCLECRKQLIADRAARGKARKDEPQWVHDALAKTGL